MILVDTNVWVDHLRRGDAALAHELESARVLTHPWVIGELALGGLGAGTSVLALLANLPAAVPATATEVLAMIQDRGLAGSGIGYVDAHLLASTLLTPGATLWTRDRRLSDVAAECSVGSVRR